MLISVHLPKTAGSSFLKSLEDHFGDRLYRDYRDFPLNVSRPRRRGWAIVGNFLNIGGSLHAIECIHGHFLPAKYFLLSMRRPTRFVTWMRHPVERLASHYKFWRESYDSAASQPLHRRVVEEDWSFERFSLSPSLRNVYGQFLWCFPLSRFSFVGITEHYEEDLSLFADSVLGTTLQPYSIRTHADRQTPGYGIADDLRQAIETFHRDDMMLYREALRLRHERTRRAPVRSRAPA